jgi:hypothetical protein
MPVAAWALRRRAALRRVDAGHYGLGPAARMSPWLENAGFICLRFIRRHVHRYPGRRLQRKINEYANEFVRRTELCPPPAA